MKCNCLSIITQILVNKPTTYFLSHTLELINLFHHSKNDVRSKMHFLKLTLTTKKFWEFSCTCTIRQALFCAAQHNTWHYHHRIGYYLIYQAISWDNDDSIMEFLQIHLGNLLSGMILTNWNDNNNDNLNITDNNNNIDHNFNTTWAQLPAGYQLKV